MDEETTPPKRGRMDSNRVDHQVFGSPVEKLPSNRFPTLIQVVNRVRFLKSQKLISNREIYNSVADDLIKTWESAYVVPIINKKTLADRLDTVVEKKIKYANKNLNIIMDVNKPVIGIPELQSHSVSDALALVDSVEKKIDSCHQTIQVYVAARSFNACSNSK